MGVCRGLVWALQCSASPLSPAAVDHSSCTFQLVEENGVGDGKPDFLSFSPEMVAEQFTLMDAVSSHTPAGSVVLWAQAWLFPSLFPSCLFSPQRTPRNPSPFLYFPGAVQESGALPLSGLHLVPERQEGQRAPGPHHPCHSLPVQQRGQLCHCHLSWGQVPEATAEGQGGGAVDRSGSGRTAPLPPPPKRDELLPCWNTSRSSSFF